MQRRGGRLRRGTPSAFVTGGVVFMVAAGGHAATVTTPDWLAIVNSYRSQAGLPAVTYNATYADGELRHARYMVKNNQVAHSETPGNAWFSTQGNVAAQSSNIYGNLDVTTADAAAFESWMTGPFHSIGLLDPRLKSVTYASYRESDGGVQMAADVDVIHGLVFSPLFSQYPVMWPGNGARTSLTRYSGGEMPDPLTSCPGFTAPTGLPIILQIGSGNHAITVTAYSFKQGTTLLASHVFTGSNYVNPNASLQATGRSILAGRDAIVLIPRAPLVPGKTYTPSITANGHTYTWSFTVTGPAPTLTAVSPATAPNAGLTPVVTLTGTNFVAGATVMLTRAGQTAVSGTSATVLNATQLTCRFNLTGKAAGAWNVVVKNPDGQLATRVNGLTVTAAAPQPDLLIKGASEALTAYAGATVYQATPAGTQIKSLTVAPLGSVAYNVLVRNTGTLNGAFVVKATESSEAGWTVSYRVGTADITAQLHGATGHTTVALAPGAGEVITVLMLPPVSVVSGASKRATVQVFQNALDHTVRDAVQAVATVPVVAIARASRGVKGFSSVAADVATASVVLTASTALDGASAADPARYTVWVNGHRVAVEAAAYNGVTHRVSLQLADDALRRGDQVWVAWTGLAAAGGQPLTSYNAQAVAR